MTGLSRRGRDRLVSAGREGQPFTVHLIDRDGVESRIEARAVIDASGTWRQPNPAGADGLPALGERAAAAAGVLTYLPPTPAQVDGFAGRHVVVLGSGHSALTAVSDLATAVGTAPGTRVTWVLRRALVGDTFGAAPGMSCRSGAPSVGGPGRRSRTAWCSW